MVAQRPITVNDESCNRGPRLEPCLEVFETAGQTDRLWELPGHDFGRLVAVARHGNDGRIVRSDDTPGDEVDRRGDGRAARGFGKDALCLGEEPYGGDNLGVADGGTAAA